MRWVGLSVLICLTACGCRDAASVPAASSSGAPPTESAASPPAQVPSADQTANEILAHLLTTYRQAKTYQDAGVIRLSFRQNGQPVAEELPAAVAFERPAKLAVRAYQATVTSDGKQLKARIEDPQSNDVDNQLLVRTAPNPIKIADLATDRLLYDILSSRLRRQPIQLELLLESSGLVSAFNADVACQRLTDERHGGQLCYRVEVPSPGGAFVFWVDQQSGLLRRLDYPAAALVPDLASDRTVSDLRLIADLRSPRINERIAAEQFELKIPPGAKQVKSFVVPPRPLPSELFGQQPQDFFFTTLSGDKLTREELEGKIVVLVWYHDNPACEATMQQIGAAADRLKNAANVRFFAVATDPTTKAAADLQKRLSDWNVSLPIVRDLEAFGDKAFHIEVQPTLVVLDPRGCVQIFQPGGSPELANQLVTIVERLARGEDIAAEIVEQHTREKREYDQQIAKGGAEPDEVLELPEAVIRKRSEPKKVQLTPLWTNSELREAGNLLVSGSGQQANVLAIQGWRAVVELDARGQIVARHPPEIPEQGAITFLRTAVDKQGNRFYAASAPLAPQVFVFDDKWNLRWAFPSAGQAPLQVMDVAFAALGEDGELDLLVAGAGGVGMVCLSGEGQLRWRNDAFPSALAVAISPRDDFGALSLLVAGESGSVLRINRYGNEDKLYAIANRPAGRIYSSGQADSPQAATYLILSANEKGEPLAVGLSSELKELWNYPLPPGVHQKPIEAVTYSHMLPGHEGEWWLAGPDGSVHLITADGHLFDSFHHGAVLTGVAAASLNNQPTLLVASTQGITAWTVAVRPTRTAVER